MSEQIKMLKAMLEGRMPIQLDSLGESNPTVTERIVYRTVGENKENGDSL
jgi:hypothetical protein